MRNMVKISIVAALQCLAGCTALGGRPPAIGDSIAMVEQQLGKPTATYSLGSGQELEYDTGPMGQYTYMAHFGADGRLTSYQQVLTSEKFATIKIGSATKEDVLRTIGHPAEKSTLPLKHYEVWSYRYKENDVWNSLMSVSFDSNGIVQQLQNGPDPMYEERDRRR